MVRPATNVPALLGLLCGQSGLTADSAGELTERVEAATRSYRWQSAVKWGAAIGLAVPVTVAIGVWALEPSVAGRSTIELRYAIQRLSPCTIGKESHVCVAVDAKQKTTVSDHEALVVVKGF